MEEIEKLKLKRVHLGGTGTMFLARGKERDYIYKPAESKFSKKPEPFRGIVQECAYEIQKIVDPDSAVVCKYINSGKISGSVQELIVVSNDSKDYHDLQYGDRISELTSSEISQFMREFVTDYLLCNFDSHGRNFITDRNGIIRGIDKEQSFRYMNEEEALTPSIDFSPNTEIYGETEPIYNTIFRAYRDGKLDINFSDIEKCMDRVDRVPFSDYRQIFVPYCEACGEAFGEDPNKKLDNICARRITMRENIKGFFQQLTEEREANLRSGKGK